ncbi:MAG: lytic murein transglycosylase [Devosia sp.]
MRPLIVISFLIFSVASAHAETFSEFLSAFESKAVAAGVSRAVYREATAGLTADDAIPNLVESQPEFTTPIWDYLDKRITASRISRGQKAMKANAALFDATGMRYGVDPYLLAAIWGIETDYGEVLASKSLIKPIIRSLATLAYHKRGRLKEDEADFIAALLLVQEGPKDAAHLVGSWAGAIGHLQVNPSNVIAHGADGDGDGRVDLHGSLPDALATSATFLRDLGYQPGLDWGFEVVVPDGFDWLLADRETLRPISFFTGRGISRVKGRPFADEAVPVFLYAPAGRGGPKFLMTGNYLVLKGYNFSDSYALSVAHLADRLKGGGEFFDDWPRKTAFPNLAQRKAIQDALIALGLYDGVVDGRIGPVSQAAYARFQAQKGEVADGFITLGAYEELIAATR